MRLHSFLKNNYDLTKSKLLDLHKKGLIKVNGKNETLLYEVGEDDIVTVGDDLVERKKIVYYLYNKPIGVTCTNSIDKPNNLKDLNLPQRVFSLGRLDKDSHGLLILTNDGELSNKLMNSSSHVEKEYVVKVKYELTESFIKRMEEGVVIDGKLTKKAKLKKIDNFTFGIILTEGRNRQIRKMTKTCSNVVLDLERVRIGKVLLGNLPLGEIKEVNLSELID